MRSLLSDDGSIFPEIKYRAGTAINGAKEVHQLLKTRKLQPKPKVNLVRSICMSQLLYNCANHSFIPPGAMCKLSSSYNNLYRKALLTRDADGLPLRIKNENLFNDWDLPPLPSYVHKLRIKYFCRFVLHPLR